MASPIVSEHDALKLPPHSIEAEQSILGAIMLDNSVLDRINGSLSGEHFYSAAHRLIFEHEQSLHREGQPIDVTTLQVALETSGQLEYIGGPPYLGALVQSVPTAVNAEHYAHIVRERAECRHVAALALDVHDAAMHSRGLSHGDVRERLSALLRQAEAVGRPRWIVPTPITEAEFEHARPAPDCIVESYLFSDVGVLIAPGGTGKTTLELYEAIHVTLKRSLYNLAVHKPGPVLILTAEDSREMLVARLRLIAEAMQLTRTELATVMRDIRISDVSGRGMKLTTVADDVVVPALLLDTIIGECQSLQPVLIIIDPAISFGIGEGRVNDAEQGLIEVARRIRGELNCCVRYVHHSGKQNARDKVIDQYAGRGGSAFADGARMVAVLQPLTAEEWLTATGMSLMDGETAMVLARPKLSYCAPATDILITRKGYSFSHTSRLAKDKAMELQANCDQLLRAIEHDLTKGVRHTQASLEALRLFPRADLRDAISTLLANQRIVKEREPKKGGAQYHFRVQGPPNSPGERSQ